MKDGEKKKNPDTKGLIEGSLPEIDVNRLD